MPKLPTTSIAVITSCTSRKEKTAQVAALSSNWAGCSVVELAADWKRTVRSQDAALVVARELYQGRSFRDAELAAQHIGGSLFIVSAGLGLVAADAVVPAYELTVSTGRGSIEKQLAGFNAKPSDWWTTLGEALERPTPLLNLLHGETFSEVWLAAPSTYLDLLRGELDQLPLDVGHGKLRVFTSEKGVASLPSQLRECALPYDLRLEATTYTGTTGDFPQRCLRHYAEALSGTGLSLPLGRARVLASLEGLVARSKPERTKLADEQIKQLLRKNWERHDGSSSRLLRFLRDDAQVACEQGRFRNLWHCLKQELVEQGR